ncbi:hypothetical protein HGA64_00225 [Candidatus Falkowbacteria bacterium]|nr:hypothetical protein [Candidatus Falkowbacteria bacterium]
MIKTFVSLVSVLIFLSLLPASLSNAKIPPELAAPITPKTEAPPEPPKEEIPTYEVVETLHMKVTAYYKVLKNQKRFSRKRNGRMRTYAEERRMQGSGITATRTHPRPGTIAANLERFPAGTIFRIKQKKHGRYVVIMVGVAEDTGGSMIENPNQLDLFMGSGEEGLKRAETFGVRHGMIVEVLKKVEA